MTLASSATQARSQHRSLHPNFNRPSQGGSDLLGHPLEAGLIDEMHLAVSPVLLGAGEHLLAGIDLRALGFAQVEYVGTQKAAHYLLTKQR
jgi:dihydrofolate reductase